MHLRILALLVVIALTPLRAQIIPAARRLRTGVAGEIPVGISVDSLYAIVGRERTRVVDLQMEGFFTPAIEILSRAGGPRAMQAHIAATACGFLISRVDVFDPTYRTESGLRVGVTLGDVRRRHSVTLSAEEGAHAFVEYLGIAFELTSDTGADSTHVVAIRIDGPDAADLCRRPSSPTSQRALPPTGRTRPAPAAPSPAQSADSLVLERTRCFGTCPAYRLSLTAAGHVSFVSRNPRDSTRAQDDVAPNTLASLLTRADAFRFFSLPNRIQDDGALCSTYATDSPTVTVTIYRVGGAKAVEDYHGCYGGTGTSATDVVRSLRAFQTAVDSATNARRWIRPAQLR